MTDEQINRESRKPESGDEQQVVGDDGVHTAGEKRRGRQRRQDDRVGKRQRKALRVKDVCVELVSRVAHQLMVDPGDPPCGEERIAQIRNVIKVANLVMQEDGNGQADTQAGDDRVPRGTAHEHAVAASKVSTMVRHSSSRLPVAGALPA